MRIGGDIYIDNIILTINRPFFKRKYPVFCFFGVNIFQFFFIHISALSLSLVVI